MTHNRAIRYLTVVLLVHAISIPALPWGNDGHQLVARVAARNLTDTARRQIVALLRTDTTDDLKLRFILGSGTPTNEQVEEALATIATWPDHMPGGKGVTQPWHFIDIGLFEGPSHMNERCDAGCVNQKITELIQHIRQRQNLDKFEPFKQLRFLVHFLGDVHQPLHCVTNADAGGNCVRTTDFDGSTELHSVFDTPLVREVMDTVGADTTAALIQEFQSHKAAFQAQTDPNKIAAESFQLAKEKVYAKAHPRIPTIGFFVDVSPKDCRSEAPPSIRRLKIDVEQSYDNDETLAMIRQQLYKGGVRLARVLNDLFPEQH